MPDRKQVPVIIVGAGLEATIAQASAALAISKYMLFGETLADDTSLKPGLHLDGRPGTRVPHVWLDQAGVRVSTLDLIGE